MKLKLIFIFWTALILILMSVPSSVTGPTVIIAPDKLGHAVVFGIWGLMLWQILEARWKVVLLSVLFAISTELYQLVFIPGRAADVYDVIADLVGIGLFILVYRAAFKTEVFVRNK